MTAIILAIQSFQDLNLSQTHTIELFFPLTGGQLYFQLPSQSLLFYKGEVNISSQNKQKTKQQ